MSTTVASTLKFKRATEARWEELNPILEQGEPGFVYNKHLLKIGDGITPWKDLPYIGGKADIINSDTVEDFPLIGDPNIIYKAANELSLYQFNPTSGAYEKLSDGKSIDNINLINGGDANG